MDLQGSVFTLGLVIGRQFWGELRSLAQAVAAKTEAEYAQKMLESYSKQCATWDIWRTRRLSNCKHHRY